MRLVILAAFLLLSFTAVSHGGKVNDGEEERKAMENNEVEDPDDQYEVAEEDLNDQYEVAEEDPEGLERDLPQAEFIMRRRSGGKKKEEPYAILRGLRRRRRRRGHRML